jgi:hypothetical protein
MSCTSRAFRAGIVGVLGAAVALGGFSTASVAAPFAQAAPAQVADSSDIVQAQAPRRVRPQVRRGVRPGVVQRRRGNDAAVAAAIGIGVLGIAAAAAASQQSRRGSYYVDNRQVPVDAWGNPIYGAPQYYQPTQGGYYYQQQPGYYQQQPRQLSRWEKDQIKAQNRAYQQQLREQARAERRQQEWQQQQAWQQQQQWRQQQGWQQQPGYWAPQRQPQRLRWVD